MRKDQERLFCGPGTICDRLDVQGKLLIVAPLSTLKFVWQREILATLPGTAAVVLHGSRAKRLALLDTTADVFIINHDGLKTIANDLYQRKDIDTLVLDELAVYRNNSQRSKHMRLFAQRFAWAWGMTGRPMPQSPTDVWAQCKILTPHHIPKYFRHARDMLMVQVSQFKWVPRANAVDTALSWMQPSVRSALADVAELPESISRTIDVEMTPQQVTVYRKMVNELAVLINEKRIVAANAAVGVNKLLQIAGGAVYTANPLYEVLDAEPRQQMLLELIDEAPEKVIVFVPYRHLLEQLTKLLTLHKIDHAVVHGGTTHREVIFNDFQNTERYRVLLAHPACVHHGLTLTKASTAIWYAPYPSLEVYEQANARIRRVGQNFKQQYFHLQSTGVERKLYAGLRNKQKNTRRISRTYKNGDRNAGLVNLQVTCYLLV